MKGEPCYCGAPDCSRCYPGSYRQFRAQAAHEEHDDPDLTMEECPQCVSPEEAAQARAEAEYDRMKDEWEW